MTGRACGVPRRVISSRWAFRLSGCFILPCPGHDWRWRFSSRHMARHAVREKVSCDMEPRRPFSSFLWKATGACRFMFRGKEKGVRHVYRLVFTPAFFHPTQIMGIGAHERRARIAVSPLPVCACAGVGPHWLGGGTVRLVAAGDASACGSQPGAGKAGSSCASSTRGGVQVRVMLV